MIWFLFLPFDGNSIHFTYRTIDRFRLIQLSANICFGTYFRWSFRFGCDMSDNGGRDFVTVFFHFCPVFSTFNNIELLNTFWKTALKNRFFFLTDWMLCHTNETSRVDRHYMTFKQPARQIQLRWIWLVRFNIWVRLVALFECLFARRWQVSKIFLQTTRIIFNIN